MGGSDKQWRETCSTENVARSVVNTQPASVKTSAVQYEARHLAHAKELSNETGRGGRAPKVATWSTSLPGRPQPSQAPSPQCWPMRSSPRNVSSRSRVLLPSGRLLEPQTPAARPLFKARISVTSPNTPVSKQTSRSALKVGVCVRRVQERKREQEREGNKRGREIRGSRAREEVRLPDFFATPRGLVLRSCEFKAGSYTCLCSQLDSPMFPYPADAASPPLQHCSGVSCSPSLLSSFVDFSVSLASPPNARFVKSHGVVLESNVPALQELRLISLSSLATLWICRFLFPAFFCYRSTGKLAFRAKSRCFSASKRRNSCAERGSQAACQSWRNSATNLDG